MSGIQSYRDLIAWQRAFQVGVAAHELSCRFPDHERFGLTAQVRRHATLIASLIADGYGQQNTGHYLRFRRQARGAFTTLTPRYSSPSSSSTSTKTYTAHLHSRSKKPSRSSPA